MSSCNFDVDIALGAATWASSTRADVHLSLPDFAVDGYDTTRWESQFSDPQWIALDLGSPQELCAANILWEEAFCADYAIQLGNEDPGGEISWTDAIRKVVTSSGWSSTRFSPATEAARYVRIYCHRRGTIWGNSIWTLKLYAPPTPFTPPPSPPPQPDSSLAAPKKNGK